jgi:hypothetical protein
MSTEGIYSTIAPAVDTTVVLPFQTLPLDFTIRREGRWLGLGLQESDHLVVQSASLSLMPNCAQ